MKINFLEINFSDDELGFNVLKDFTQMTDYEGMLGSGGGVNRNYALRNISKLTASMIGLEVRLPTPEIVTKESLNLGDTSGMWVSDPGVKT